jgi:16S rRNA (uracil1498-N3)-methyltransferase
MHRFLIDRERPDVIGGEEHRHLTRVLRLRTGDRVELLDGETITLAQIVRIDKEQTVVQALETLPSREPNTRLTLYLGSLKGEKMDWVLQKAQELGAYAFVPVLMKRSIGQGGKTERLQRIAREAQKQCGRARVLSVEETQTFAEALGLMRAHETMIVPYEAGGIPLTNVRLTADIGVLIGPEGGIEPREIDALRGVGAHIVTLGSRILRAETAAVATVAALMALAGEWA